MERCNICLESALSNFNATIPKCCIIVRLTCKHDQFFLSMGLKQGGHYALKDSYHKDEA